MHARPEIITYSGEQLADLVGPVETQYCDVQVQPSRVYELDQVALIVDISDMPGFDEVLVEGIGVNSGGSPLPRSAGEIRGDQWIVNDAFDTDVSPGVYNIAVRLVDGDKISEPCFTSLTVEID